jgi:hypothetical protein
MYLQESIKVERCQNLAMPYPCRPHSLHFSLALISPSHHVKRVAYTLLLMPVHFPTKGLHGIGQTSRAQTRQKRARHAVSAPRRRPGRARARHRTAASALPYLSISATRTLTPPATHQTSSLASGGPVDVAMIKVLPPWYCTHLIIACTPPSTIRCAVALNSSA